MFDLERFLKDREERVELQNFLQEEYKRPLVAVRANYPGTDKLEPIAQEITDIMSGEIEGYFEGRILHREILISLEGKIYLYVIDDEVWEIKRKTVHIEENHILGRCIDLDVYHADGTGVSRTSLGYPKRKCLICDETAFLCARSMRHPHSEIKEEIYRRYRNYRSFLSEQREEARYLAMASLKSMVLEVSSSPSFGLVSPHTQGSHRDMDYFTFLDSSFAIERYFEDMASLGYSYLEVDEIFRRIRYIGMEAEENMFGATGGVNTHKGMVFLMGIAVAAAGKALYEGNGLLEMERIIAHMCRDILADFYKIEEKIRNGEKITHGEKLYMEHGISGVRGVVKDGLKVIFRRVLPSFEEGIEKGYHINDVMTQTLLLLMQELEDSTILYRHDFKTLKEVQERAKGILKKGGAYTPQGKDMCKEVEKEFIDRHISPGGSADLLAVTLFLYTLIRR